MQTLTASKKPFSVLPLALQITKPADFCFLFKSVSLFVHKQAQLCDYREETGMEEKKGREGNCALTLDRGKIDLRYT